MKTIIILTAAAWVAALARPATAQTLSLETAPPVVVKTVPVAGAAEVDSSLTEIRVTYSKPMQDGSWSWSTWSEGSYPETTGKPRYLADRRTCVLPVKLEPAKFYAIWLNSAKFKNFKDASGRSAVPYLLTFTTATKTAGAADPGPLPAVEDLPGKLVFHGRYQHRSRGRDIETPSELWLKKTAGGGLRVLASLPWMGTRELATGDAANQLTSYWISGDSVGGRPGHRVDLKLRDGSALLTRRGIRQDLTNKELKVPDGVRFDPNTRPDSYCAANILLRAFALKPDETRKFHMVDWDNAGEALVDYTIEVRHAGRERVEVPAGTFEANHLVLTQLTSADTWFKKRAGHVTDFWVLDNGLIARVLRHREPYEMVLLDYSVPDKLDTAPPAGAETDTPAKAPAGAPARVTVGLDGDAQFKSIQAAVDAVAEGGTIEIGAGRYEESLEVTKPLRLIGAGWEETVIGPTSARAKPAPEVIREMEQQLRAAKSDAERARLREEFARRFQAPVLLIQGAKKVCLEGLKLTLLGSPPEGSLASGAVVAVKFAELVMRNCAIVGSPANGVFLTDGASADIQHTLIAAAWNRGVTVENNSRVVLRDCDIRNCHYAGVTLKRGSGALIEHCRISGAAWHGIRYDDASPKIEGNLIFGNARSGIYASGSTAAQVRLNGFFNNEMNGISCWFDNKDLIEGNTFANNRREALSILGASSPTVRKNIFSGHPAGLVQGGISGGKPGASPGQPLVEQNLFWDNTADWVRHPQTGADGAAQAEVVALNAATRSLTEDPGFVDAARSDYALKPGSPALRDGIGAPDLIPSASPWPLQPEEKAIIPEGDTRDSRQWKRTAG